MLKQEVRDQITASLENGKYPSLDAAIPAYLTSEFDFAGTDAGARTSRTNVLLAIAELTQGMESILSEPTKQAISAYKQNAESNGGLMNPPTPKVAEPKPADADAKVKHHPNSKLVKYADDLRAKVANAGVRPLTQAQAECIAEIVLKEHGVIADAKPAETKEDRVTAYADLVVQLKVGSAWTLIDATGKSAQGVVKTNTNLAPDGTIKPAKVNDLAGSIEFTFSDSSLRTWQKTYRAKLDGTTLTLAGEFKRNA